MRTDCSILQIIFVFFLLSVTSCVNHDFDFDNEKLDKNATFGDSLNLPLGNIQKISILEELRKMYDQIRVGETDRILYIGYEGTFPAEFPDYEIPTVELLTVSTPIEEVSGGVILPPGIEIPLIQENKAKYEVERPRLINETDLTVISRKVGFDSFVIHAGFELPGIDFESVGDDAQLTVFLTFPANFTLKNPTEDYTIQSSVFIKDIIGLSYCSLGKIEVDSYVFEDGESELTYRVVLNSGNDFIRLQADNPEFNLILETDNENIAVSYLDCSVDGTKEFDGAESGFGDLQSAFGENNILKFKDPSVAVDLTTNLGCAFEFDIKMFKNDTPAFLNAPLQVKRSDEVTHYEYKLTTENFVNFDEIVSTPLADELAYAITLTFNNQEATLLPSEQLLLTTDYSFNIPFNFKEVYLNMRDTITNIFDEDIYDQVFSHAKKDVSIQADVVDISTEKGIFDLNISAVILDSDFNEIIRVGSELNRTQTPNLAITIKEEDMEKMKDARHLEFVFQLTGEGAISEDDYIKIDGVRLVSGSGIYFKF
ncbi:MAG: DUF4621 domain-containing protein [Dysgonamonadaceae bacterium]|jgi:hypothetical protein|nr:DUF4621 domain-containing protein [Dysgonamonadaceae bacterium]